MSRIFLIPQAKRGGFFGEIIRWFIMVAIYDICIGTIAQMFGISRIAACFIFLGALLAGSFVAYVIRQKMSPPADQ